MTDNNSGFQLNPEHTKIALIVMGVLFVIGAGIAGKSWWDYEKEAKVQSQYFLIEKDLLKTRTEFLQAKEAANMPAKEKEKFIKENPDFKIPTGSSGDFEKDYGTIAQRVTEFVKTAPQSKAAKMAALNLSEVQVEYGKNQEALDLLSSVREGSKDMLHGLVHSQLGSIEANLQKCDSAVSTWSQVISNKQAQFLHNAVKLKMGLCYESLNQFDKAKESYTQVRDADKEGGLGKTAEKYLRLLSSKGA